IANVAVRANSPFSSASKSGIIFVSPNHGRFLLYLSPGRRGFLFCSSQNPWRVVSAGSGRNALRSVVERGHLRPTRKRCRALPRQRKNAAIDAEEPAVDIAQQNLRCIRDGASDLRGAPRTVRERSRAGERLLPIGGHDRRLAAAAGGGIAE